MLGYLLGIGIGRARFAVRGLPGCGTPAELMRAAGSLPIVSWRPPASPRRLTTVGHDCCNACDHLVGFEVISALNLLRIVSPTESKFSATVTKAPGPPITLLR